PAINRLCQGVDRARPARPLAAGRGRRSFLYPGKPRRCRRRPDNGAGGDGGHGLNPSTNGGEGCAHPCRARWFLAVEFIANIRWGSHGNVITSMISIAARAVDP